MRLSNTEQNVFITFVVLLILIAGGLLFIKPQYEEWGKNKEELKARLAEQKDMNEKLVREPTIDDEILASYTSGKNISDWFYPEMTAFTADNLTQSIFRKLGVTVNSLDISSMRPETFKVEVGIDDKVLDYDLRDKAHVDTNFFDNPGAETDEAADDKKPKKDTKTNTKDKKSTSGAVYGAEHNYASAATGTTAPSEEVAEFNKEVSDIDKQTEEEAEAVSSVERINLYEQFKSSLESMDDNRAVDYFLNMEMTEEQRRGTLDALVEAMVNFMQDKNQTVAARDVKVNVIMTSSQLKRLQDLVFHSKHAMSIKIETLVDVGYGRTRTVTTGVTDATYNANGPQEYNITITYYCVERLTEPPFIRNLRVKKLQQDSNISEADASQQLEKQAAEEATSTFDAVAEMEDVYDNQVDKGDASESATATTDATATESTTELTVPEAQTADETPEEPASVPVPREASDEAVGSVGDDESGGIETDATAA